MEKKEANGVVSEECKDSWAVLMDKRYQGYAENLRCTITGKRPINCNLCMALQTSNCSIASDRIIVEMFFGRMATFWAVIYMKWSWDEGNYENVFKLCMCLTNLHIKWHPIKGDGNKRTDLYLKRLTELGVNRVEKRKKALETFLCKRAAWMRAQFDCGEKRYEYGTGVMLDLLDE